MHGRVDNQPSALERHSVINDFLFLRFVQLILVTFVMQLGKKPLKDCWYVKTKSICKTCISQFRKFNNEFLYCLLYKLISVHSFLN